MPQSGFEPMTLCTEGGRLIHYSIEEEMKERVLKDNLNTQQSLRNRPRAQGPKGPRAFFEAVASHRGQMNLKLLLENSRPTAYYFQRNS